MYLTAMMMHRHLNHWILIKSSSPSLREALQEYLQTWNVYKLPLTTASLASTGKCPKPPLCKTTPLRAATQNSGTSPYYRDEAGVKQ